MKNKKEFGQLIVLLRNQNGLSQKELADKLNISPPAVSKWERGINSPDVTLISEIAKLLHISCEELTHPIETLDKLAHTTIEKKRTFPIRWILLGGILCLLLGGGILYHQLNSRITLVQTRALTDSTYGSAYEMAFYSRIELSDGKVKEHSEKVYEDWLQNTDSSTEQVLQISYYSSRENAQNWEEPLIISTYFKENK